MRAKCEEAKWLLTQGMWARRAGVSPTAQRFEIKSCCSNVTSEVVRYIKFHMRGWASLSVTRSHFWYDNWGNPSNHPDMAFGPPPTLPVARYFFHPSVRCMSTSTLSQGHFAQLPLQYQNATRVLSTWTWYFNPSIEFTRVSNPSSVHSVASSKLSSDKRFNIGLQQVRGMSPGVT